MPNHTTFESVSGTSSVKPHTNADSDHRGTQQSAYHAAESLSILHSDDEAAVDANLIHFSKYGQGRMGFGLGIDFRTWEKGKEVRTMRIRIGSPMAWSYIWILEENA